MRPRSDVEAKAIYNPGNRFVEVYLWDNCGSFQRESLGVETVVTEEGITQSHRIKIKEVDFNKGVDAPAFRLDLEDAQALMDSLWNCGLRPIGAAGSMGQLEAVQNHLEDMRAIALTNEQLERRNKRKSW